jgi:hypothetical protein
MTIEHAVAANAAAIRNLAARLENWGLSDPHERAEHIVLNLAADGFRPLEPPPAPRGPGARRESIDAAKQAAAEAVRAARERRTATRAQKENPQ